MRIRRFLGNPLNCVFSSLYSVLAQQEKEGSKDTLSVRRIRIIFKKFSNRNILWITFLEPTLTTSRIQRKGFENQQELLRSLSTTYRFRDLELPNKRILNYFLVAFEIVIHLLNFKSPTGRRLLQIIVGVGGSFLLLRIWISKQQLLHQNKLSSGNLLFDVFRLNSLPPTS